MERFALRNVVHAVVFPVHRFAPEDLMVFVQARKFSERWDGLGLTDEDLQALEMAIMAAPKGAPVVTGTGGLRKLRFASPQWSKGKRGGFRVCYVYFEEVQVIHLLVIYGKSEKDTISLKQKVALKQLIGEIRRSLAGGSFR